MIWCPSDMFTAIVVMLVASSVTILLLIEEPNEQHGYAQSQSENLTQSQSENLTQIITQTVSKIPSCSLTALAQSLGVETGLLTDVGEDMNLCVTVIHENPTRVVFTGDYIGSGLVYNTGIWEVVDALEARGLSLDSGELTGEGSKGNPHSYLIVM